MRMQGTRTFHICLGSVGVLLAASVGVGGESCVKTKNSLRTACDLSSMDQDGTCADTLIEDGTCTSVDFQTTGGTLENYSKVCKYQPRKIDPSGGCQDDGPIVTFIAECSRATGSCRKFVPGDGGL